LKVDENEFEEDNSHNETTEKSVSLATISSEQYLLIVNFFMKYNKFGLTRASIHSW
jgi:hypothetical protein